MKIFINQEGKKYAAKARKSDHDSEVMHPHPDLVTVLSHPNAGARNDAEIAIALHNIRNPTASE